MSAPISDSFEMAVALADLSEWLIQQGLGNVPVETWLDEFCHKAVASGIPLTRVNVTTRAHHPEIGAVAFRWKRDTGNERFDYARSTTLTDDYVTSPLYHLVTNKMTELRQRLQDPEPEFNFPIFDELRAAGATDYYVTKRLFVRHDVSRMTDGANPEEGAIISFAGDNPGGFSQAQLDGLRSLVPPLCLTLKCNANRLMAEHITSAYMGQDASRRVLSGAIRRGSSQTIQAVICAFDLQGFTKMSEVLPGTAIIDMLNDYFAECVEIIEDNGGNVLKFMGDGLLAIFDLETIPTARSVAVESAAAMQQKFAEINVQREKDGLPVTGFKLALHAGNVLYGNIGGKTRLDFTVIGPAVNTTARILGMCDFVDQTIVISDDVAAEVLDKRSDVVSLGQYRLRGVKERHRLYTLD